MADNLVALRVGTAQWMSNDGFHDLMQFLLAYPRAVDEVILFTSFTHAPIPLDEMGRRCDRLAHVLPEVRRAGYRVGINVLTSMGHHEENLIHSLAEPWPRVTDPHGNICRGSYCPASPELLDYVRRIYTMVAKIGPDYIWVDDDVRLYGHLPVLATCFCDECIVRFNAEFGATFTRETLVAATQGEPSLTRDLWRDRWIEHNRRMIAALLSAAAQATHRVAPDIVMGFMTGDRFYEGYAFAEWSDTLVSTASEPPRWRPGGGFYSDDTYMGLVEKAHDIGRQVSQLPANVRVIQSEIENFPYQKLRKSVTITMLEAAAHMAAGATGPAFNIISSNDPLEEFLPFLSAIDASKSFFGALRESVGRSPPQGIWPAWNANIFADHGARGDWLRQNESVAALRRSYVLAELGLPMAYSVKGARISLLSGPLPAAFDRSELEHIFAGGVLMDVPALHSLSQLGLSEWAGVQANEGFDHDMSEVLSDHWLNGRFARWSRDCRQSFWPATVYRLDATAQDVEVLAHLTDYAGTGFGPCMSVFQNALGGRVVVAGYYPWMLIHSLSKSSQLKAVCRWLSDDTVPIIAETYARIVLWARNDDRGNLVAILLNASMDFLPNITLRARAQASRVQHLTMSGEEHELFAQACGRDHVVLVLRDLQPWSMHLLHWH